MDDQTLKLIEVVGLAEAGFYALKGLGYMWLKSRLQDLPEPEMQQKAEDSLRVARQAFLFPTPLDLFYLTRGIAKLIKKYSQSDNNPQPQETTYPTPYSKSPRTLDFVDQTHSDSQPFKFTRRLELIN